MPPALHIFGFGYTGEYLATLAKNAHWSISGTSRRANHRRHLQSSGYEVADFTTAGMAPLLAKATHLLISAPLTKEWQDPVLTHFESLIRAQSTHLQWIGYLSTTGIYGDHQGAWIDESTIPKPKGDRAIGRLRAEAQWLHLGEEMGVPTHVFRLAGIYGPGRNALHQLKNGTARPIYKQGQVFSRIHVKDIARIIMGSIHKPQPTTVYNVCDDAPAPSYEVIEYAAQLMNLPVPERIPFAQANLSEMGQEFYESNRRVKNDKVKNALGIALTYPTYREGLRALLASGEY